MYTVTLQKVKSSGLMRSFPLTSQSTNMAQAYSLAKRNPGAHLGNLSPVRGTNETSPGLDWPAMAEEDGVLGNLPRSRPGKRSDKRGAGRPAGAAGAATAKAEETAAPAARPAPAAKTAARPCAKPAAAEPTVAADPSPKTDPVPGAVRAATKVAGTGVRVAGAVAHEILRRVPRP
jgi:hypothetical protein